MIVITLPATGTYSIVANTFESEQAGQYQIEWRVATDKEQALAPANQLIQQAQELYSSGQYSDAIPLAERALAFYEAQLGPEHPDTARSLNNLAALYTSMSRYGEAESLYQRALAIHETQLGLEHPDTADSMNNLAGLYWAQGKLQNALRYLQQGLTVQETVLSRNLLGGQMRINEITSLPCLAPPIQSSAWGYLRFGTSQALYPAVAFFLFYRFVAVSLCCFAPFLRFRSLLSNPAVLTQEP